MSGIVDPNPVIERILGEVDAKVNHTIVGPDGVTPLLDPVVDDRTLTYSKNGEEYKASPEQFLMSAARMQRDGMSLQAIRVELDLVGDISDRTLQAALNQGHAFLDLAIKEGREPGESVRVVGYRIADDEVTAAEVQADTRVGETDGRNGNG